MSSESKRLVKRARPSFITRMIPSVATVSLTLTGCIAPDNGKVSNAELKRLCKKVKDCNKSYFYESYDNVGDCVEDLGRRLETYLDEYDDEYGEACARAYEDLTECNIRLLTDARCEDGYLEVDDYDACYEEVYEKWGEDVCYD